MARNKRKHLSKEEIQRNAREGSGGLSRCFDLPEGVELWAPDKKGTYDIDVFPYEVTIKNHPDGGVEPGTVWFKRIVIIHGGLGADGRTMAICPQEIGKKCPIHEQRAKYAKRKDADDEVLRKMDGKKFVLMNIQHPEDKKARAILCMSSGKFWSYKGGGLKKELDEMDPSDPSLGFFDCKEGKTLRVRFSKESFNGKDFLQASRFDFKDRKSQDEDKVLKKSVDLDKILVILPHEKLEEMFTMEESSSSTSSSGSSSSSASSESSEEEESSSASSKESKESEESSSASSESSEEESSKSSEESGSSSESAG